MAGGSKNYSESYSRYKHGNATDADYSKYVDAKHSNYWKLIDAYNKGEDVDTKFAGQYQHPAGLSPSQQAEYWQKRGATSKSAFGRAHAAEDDALRSGTYMGGTDVSPYKGKTTFEKWLEGVRTSDDGGNGDDPKVTYPWDDPTNKTNVFHPMLVPDYEAPEAHSMFGAEYQPWSQASVDEGYVPENVWNYAPPQLTVGRPQWGENPMGQLSEQPWIDIENAAAAAAAAADADAADAQFREGPEGNRNVTRANVGFSSFANMLAGITIADEMRAAAAAAGLEGSGNVGATTAAGNVTPADAGFGVTYGGDPNIL